MFNNKPDAPLSVYRVRAVENNRGLLASGLPNQMIVRRLVEKLAADLVHQCVTVVAGKYETTYSLDVCILTHDQLEGYVQRRAERLHDSRPDVRLA